MAKVVVLLSPTQRAKLLQIPDNFSERDITRHYSLSAEDLAVIEQHRRPQNRLGFTVQLAYLRFPGRPWDPQEQVPPAMLTYLAEQIGQAPDVLADYATRDPTRREHLSEIQQVFEFHPFTMQAYRELSRWLMPIALSTDQGIVLMEALIEELRVRHVILPAVSILERLGWETRRRAQQQVFTTLTQDLSEEQRKQLDTLLVVPTDGRRTPLAWLREPPGPAKPSSFLKVIERLQYIRSFGLDPLLARRVHANRLRRLAHEGEQYTPQFLERFEPLRRYATLVAYLLDMTATLTDTALEMHDHIMGLLFKQGQKKHLAQFEQRGKAINEKVRLYADVGNALIKAKEEAADPYGALEAVLPWETFVTSVQEARTLARPANFDYLDLLDDHYSHIRKYAPELLDTFTFHAAASSQPLAEALTLVRDLGRKKVPENAPIDFVKPRWESHVVTDDGIDRHYYELCALSELRNGLRSGDIWVEGSHEYRQFEEYLLPVKDWQELRATGTPPVEVPVDVTTYLKERKTLLHEQLTRVGQLLMDNALPDVQLSFEGNLIGDLLYEVQGQAGALPLLQFTLDQLFQQRNGSMLTQAAYHEIGGVKGALAKHVEATYTELPSDQHRVLVRALFLRLIDPGITEQDTTRRRAPLDELTLATPEETELLQQVTAYFIAARLLTTSESAGIATIEVSHEALIREWPRLSDCLWEAREDVGLQQAISEDVAEWEQRGKPGDRLYRGSQLKEAKTWAKRNPPRPPGGGVSACQRLPAGACRGQSPRRVAPGVRLAWNSKLVADAPDA